MRRLKLQKATCKHICGGCGTLSKLISYCIKRAGKKGYTLAALRFFDLRIPYRPDVNLRERKPDQSGSRVHH